MGNQHDAKRSEHRIQRPLGSLNPTFMHRLVIGPIEVEADEKAAPERGHMGVSLNGGRVPKHPKMIIFSRKTHDCWVPPF